MLFVDSVTIGDIINYYLVKILLSPFLYLNRSHFSMQTTINQVNPVWKVKSSRIKFTVQLTWTPFSKLRVDILWKFSSSFQCKIDDSVSYSYFKICLFSIQKSYFSIEKMISAIHWQLITSNLCLTHRYIGDIYLKFWKPGPSSP